MKVTVDENLIRDIVIVLDALWVDQAHDFALASPEDKQVHLFNTLVKLAREVMKVDKDLLDSDESYELIDYFTRSLAVRSLEKKEIP
jgi:hypothetical protein